VSYAEKHNEENGEENRDGHGANFSCNYGFEGPTKNPAIETIRFRQMRNFITTLMISLGTPMLLGGDEIGRTQRGNNNAYCQDNEISWYNWSFLDENRDFFRFVKEMLAFRMRHPAFLRPEFFNGKDGNYNAIPDITWFDEHGNSPDWANIDKRIAYRLDGSKADTFADRDDNDFYIMFNASKEGCPFVLAEAPRGKKWFRVIDTSLSSPEDIASPGLEQAIPSQNEYFVHDRTTVILMSKWI